MTTTRNSQRGVPKQWGGSGSGPAGDRPRPRGHIGLIVAGSLAAGFLLGLVLVFAPFIPAREGALTGALLVGFALGWAMLAGLSSRFTDQPQRWAWAPAVFMGVSGLLLIAFGSSVDDVLSLVWPPALLVLGHLDDRAYPSRTSKCGRTLAPLSRGCPVGHRLDRGRLRGRGSRDRTGGQDARSAGRCRFLPTAHPLHRLRLAHGGPPTRRGGILLGHGAGRTRPRRP